MAHDDTARVIRLVRELDEEKRKRVAAERRANALRAVIARLQHKAAAKEAPRASPPS